MAATRLAAVSVQQMPLDCLSRKQHILSELRQDLISAQKSTWTRALAQDAKKLSAISVADAPATGSNWIDNEVVPQRG